jgi:hypothetical protein
MIGFWAGIVNGKKEKISRTLYDILYQLDLTCYTLNQVVI